MKKTRELSCQTLSALCRQLAMLLKGGISLNQSLELLLQDEGADRELLGQLARQLDEGIPFPQALDQTGRFPGYMVRTVRLGDETGRLDDCLNSLADHYAREEALRRTLRSAAAYPALMMGMMVAIVVVLLTRVMPVFDQVFAQLGSRLTGLSRLLLELGNGIRDRALVLTVLLAALAFGAFLLLKQPERRSRILRAVPPVRRLLDQVSLSRFAGALAMGLNSGMASIQALELAGELVTDPVFARRVEAARQQLEQGRDLAESLKESAILTGDSRRLALVGEKTGVLDEALTRIADTAKQQSDVALEALISLIEPTLVLILSAIVGVMLLSTLMPMLSILSAL